MSRALRIYVACIAAVTTIAVTLLSLTNRRLNQEVERRRHEATAHLCRLVVDRGHGTGWGPLFMDDINIALDPKRADERQQYRLSYERRHAASRN